MSDSKVRELEIPPDAAKGGIEVLRAFVVDGALSISLQRAFDEPATWGMALVDLAQQIARVYAAETDMSEEDAMEEIREAFLDQFDTMQSPN